MIHPAAVLLSFQRLRAPLQLSLIHILAFLRDANTSASVIEIINLLDEALGAKTFSRLFPVILTDNGSEFSNTKEIEKRSTIPCNRTKIFYCDPSAPYQKGACEVNHESVSYTHLDVYKRQEKTQIR